MKRLLTTTTALSMVLSPLAPLPLLAQTELKLGDQVVMCLPDAGTACPEGASCVIIPEDPCTPEAVAAAQAAADAAAQAALDAAAQAAADAAAQAALDAAAQAAADATAQAALDAAAQAAADAAATQGAADAAAQAALDAAAQAAADAAAQAALDAAAQAAADATAQAALDAAAQAAADAAAAQAALDATAQAAADATAQAGLDAAAQSNLDAAAQATLDAAANDAAAAALSASLAATAADDAAAPAAAAIAADAPADATATVTTVTEADSRASTEDFTDQTAAATAAADPTAAKKDKGLTDLEKFGLVVLGGLAIGAILNNGDKVVSNTGDRVVVQRDDGTYTVLKDDDTLLRRPGSTVRTENFTDGSTRSTVTRDDGSRIVTIRDASGRVLKRSRIDANGLETLLIDDLAPVERIDVATLPLPKPDNTVITTQDEAAALRAALLAIEAGDVGRRFNLRQIREYREVRALAPTINVEAITFDTGSAAIKVTEAEKLARLGRLISNLIKANPAEMFLIEGHTDAVGSAASNLALSDRRAESLALALTEYYGVPPENLVVQGYGEAELKVPTEAAEVANRRAAVRLISPLLQRLAAN
ncbi:MAG: OmpA family protein [Pseudorhodobacter sp.]|nr:OmpA family protein [Pseudorhodobacter sp.]